MTVAVVLEVHVLVESSKIFLFTIPMHQGICMYLISTGQGFHVFLLAAAKLALARAPFCKNIALCIFPSY